jgi:hypothetical protein
VFSKDARIHGALKSDFDEELVAVDEAQNMQYIEEDLPNGIHICYNTTMVWEGED